MAPKKAVETKKAEEKPKKPTLSPEMKELLEQEKAIEKVCSESDRGYLQAESNSMFKDRHVMLTRRCI